MAEGERLTIWMIDEDTVGFAMTGRTDLDPVEAELADVEATFMEVGTAKFIERALDFVKGEGEFEHAPGLTGTPVDDEDDLEDDDEVDDLEDDEDIDDE